MLPTLRQRLIIVVASLAGAMVWLGLASPLRAANGDSGLTLTTARVGMGPAVLIVLAAGLPALALGAVASSTGHPLSGAFAVGAALCVLACRGGGIDAWMRDAPLPRGYGGLIAEIVVWQAWLIALLFLFQKLREPIRSRWPVLAFDDSPSEMRLAVPRTQALAAGLVCLVVAGILAYVLIRSPAGGQVIGSLLVAFTIGGMAGQLIFPQTNPLLILCTPAVLALAAYGYVLVNFHGRDEVLAAFFSLTSSGKHLPGLAMALPVQYVGAGLVGCTLGIGVAHDVDSAKRRE